MGSPDHGSADNATDPTSLSVCEAARVARPGPLKSYSFAGASIWTTGPRPGDDEVTNYRQQKLLRRRVRIWPLTDTARQCGNVGVRGWSGHRDL